MDWIAKSTGLMATARALITTSLGSGTGYGDCLISRG